MPESRPPIDLEGTSLADLQKLIDDRRLPPVDQWNPERCGHSGMLIARDGTWYHDGAPIRRPEMVRLFATVLRREPDGNHVLVTPVEKLGVDVETTAFRAVAMSTEGAGTQRRIALGLDTGDPVMLDAEHPLRLLRAEPVVGCTTGYASRLGASTSSATFTASASASGGTKSTRHWRAAPCAWR